MAAAQAILATDGGIEGISRLYEYARPTCYFGLVGTLVREHTHPPPKQPQPSRGHTG